MPAEANCDGLSDFIVPDEDGVAGDFGASFVEFFVRASNLEPCERFAVSCSEAGANVVERNSDSGTLYGHRFIEGAGVNQVGAAVGFGQGPEREALADILFIMGMDIMKLSDIGCHGHPGVGY